MVTFHMTGQAAGLAGSKAVIRNPRVYRVRLESMWQLRLESNNLLWTEDILWNHLLSPELLLPAAAKKRFKKLPQIIFIVTTNKPRNVKSSDSDKNIYIEVFMRMDIK